MFRVAVVFLLLFFAPASRAETLAGPYPADVLRVLDGDSFEARVRIWLGQDVVVIVRLAGIDAAEMDAPCPEAAARAVAARDFLAGRIDGVAVMLTDIRRDKFGGRIVARAADATGDLGAGLLAAGLARVYQRRRADWCAFAAIGAGKGEGE